MKLRMELVPVFRVDWLTYAHVQEAGRCGLGLHLARMVGRTEEIELLDVGNDTSHEVNARFEPTDNNPIWVEEREQIVARIEALGHIEVWKMGPLLLAAVERKWIPSGRYIVRVSW